MRIKWLVLGVCYALCAEQCFAQLISNKDLDLSLPARIEDVPISLKGTLQQPTYELFYLASWNESLRRLGELSFSPSEIIFVCNQSVTSNIVKFPNSELTAARQGMADGRKACVKKFEAIANDHGIGLAKVTASKCYTKIESLEKLVADSLEVPSEIEVPKELDSFVIRKGAHGEMEFMMPRMHYIHSFRLNWNEGLYNFGVRRFGIDQCNKPVCVGVSRPSFHSQLVYDEKAIDQCVARLRLLSRVIPEDDLRLMAINAISEEDLQYLLEFSNDDDEVIQLR